MFAQRFVMFEQSVLSWLVVIWRDRKNCSEARGIKAIKLCGQFIRIVSANAQDGRVTLTVADCGPGVPEETMGQIFDPFFRLEQSRSRDTGGTGLGLAIVKTCVEACQGTVTAKNRSPTGLQVELVLKPQLN